MSARSRSNPWWADKPVPGQLYNVSSTDDEGRRSTFQYAVSEPEFVGKLPVRNEIPDKFVDLSYAVKGAIRNEIEVLPADRPGETVGWMCYEVKGGEVYKLGAPDVPLTRRGDIQVGDKLIVPTLIGTLEMTATVVEDELWGETESTLANLEFGGDSRKCWASSYAINKRALKTMAR